MNSMPKRAAAAGSVVAPSVDVEADDPDDDDSSLLIILESLFVCF